MSVTPRTPPAATPTLFDRLEATRPPTATKPSPRQRPIEQDLAVFPVPPNALSDLQPATG